MLSLFIPVALLAALEMRDERSTWSTGFAEDHLRCHHHWLYSVCFSLLMARIKLYDMACNRPPARNEPATLLWTRLPGGKAPGLIALSSVFFHSHEEESLHGGRLLQERVSQRPAGALQPHAGRTPAASFVHTLMLLRARFFPSTRERAFGRTSVSSVEVL